jgi:LPXTG-site transpeptidase (sortase) family protein
VPTGPKVKETEKTISLGIVFITIGFITILSVLAILAFTPRVSPIPTLQARAILPLPTVAPTTFVRTYVVTPTPHPDAINVQAPILLPEPVIEPGQPSSDVVAADPPGSPIPTEPTQPERLVIPKLGIDSKIQRVQLVPREEDGTTYYQWQVPRGNVVGWHESSALLGQKGNTVLNGHNNIYGEVFRYLDDLELGDEIIVYDSEKPLVYQVIHQEIMPENGQPLSVRINNAQWIQPTGDERITLVTCWPYTTNSNRLVVIAVPVYSLGS